MLIKQKKAKITYLCDFCFLLFFCLLFFLLFAIRHQLRSHFKNSCFLFYWGFQTLENNKSPRPNGLGLSSVFSCLETPVKHSHSFLKYHFKNLLRDKSSLHSSLKLFKNLLHLKTQGNVSFISSYLSTSWIL